MKVWRGITLGFWTLLMAGCISLVAVYYILSQTLLNPTAVKRWLDDSGVYGQLAEVVLPMLATSDETMATNGFVTPDMLQRAAKASIKPTEVKAKVEPVIDATYAWLDSKSAEVEYSLSVGPESERFVTALRREVLVKIESLPECGTYVDIEEVTTVKCLPWYASSENAADAVMSRIQQEEVFRDKVITPQQLERADSSSATKHLPDIISLLWVIQLVAMPVAGIVALFVIAKRRANGLMAVGTALLLPGLLLLTSGLLFQVGGSDAVSGFIKQTEFGAIAEPLGRTISRSLANITLTVGGVLIGLGVLLCGLAIWWRVGSRRRAGAKASGLADSTVKSPETE